VLAGEVAVLVVVLVVFVVTVVEDEDAAGKHWL
jgi:hypothetical protein